MEETQLTRWENFKKTCKKNDLLILVLATLSLCIISLLFFILGQPDKFYKAGPIGDAFGGLTTPIINFLSVILIYLSFRQQYKANKIQKKALFKEIKRNNTLKEFEQTLDLLKDVKEGLDDFKSFYPIAISKPNLTIVVDDYERLMDDLFNSFSLLDFICYKVNTYKFKFRDEEVIFEKINLIYNEGIKDKVSEFFDRPSPYPNKDFNKQEKIDIRDFQKSIELYISTFEKIIISRNKPDLKDS